MVLCVSVSLQSDAAMAALMQKQMQDEEEMERRRKRCVRAGCCVLMSSNRCCYDLTVLHELLALRRGFISSFLVVRSLN